MITIDWLEKEKACSEAVEWASSRLNDGKPLADCITGLERADWLLWLLWHSKAVNIRQLIKLSCVAGRFSLRHVPKGEECPRRAYEAAEAWIDNPSGVAAWAAGVAAWAAGVAGVAGVAACAAGDAARAAGDAAWAAGDAAWAAGVAGVAACAAGDAARAAGDAAWSAACAARDAACAAGNAARAARDAACAAGNAARAARDAACAAGVAAWAAEHRKMCEAIRAEIKKPEFKSLVWPVEWR